MLRRPACSEYLFILSLTDDRPAQASQNASKQTKCNVAVILNFNAYYTPLMTDNELTTSLLHSDVTISLNYKTNQPVYIVSHIVYQTKVWIAMFIN